MDLSLNKSVERYKIVAMMVYCSYLSITVVQFNPLTF